MLANKSYLNHKLFLFIRKRGVFEICILFKGSSLSAKNRPHYLSSVGFAQVFKTLWYLKTSKVFPKKRRMLCIFFQSILIRVGELETWFELRVIAGWEMLRADASLHFPISCTSLGDAFAFLGEFRAVWLCHWSLASCTALFNPFLDLRCPLRKLAECRGLIESFYLEFPLCQQRADRGVGKE